MDRAFTCGELLTKVLAEDEVKPELKTMLAFFFFP